MEYVLTWCDMMSILVWGVFYIVWHFVPEPVALLTLCMVINLLAKKGKWILCPITLPPSQVCCAFNWFRRNYMKLHKSSFIC